MGTTLTGTTPQDTYDSLIKVTDNGPISGTAKYLSDGLGNDSALALSTTAVGIGTASPTEFVQISKSQSATTRLLITNSNTGGGTLTRAAMRVTANDRIGEMVALNGDSIYVGSSSNHNVILMANGGSVLTATPAGDVGIGTSTPAYKLSVSGKLGVGASFNSVLAVATFDKATAVNTFTTASNYLQIGAGENAASSTRLIGFGYSITANTNQPAYIGYIETSNTDETKGDLIFGTRDVTTDTTPTERVRILSSGGITFNGDTAAANALDDYEEGTWTPTLATDGTNFTSVTYDASNTTGKYTKIGNTVYFNGLVRTTAVTVGSASGNVVIGGLPFSAAVSSIRSAISLSEAGRFGAWTTSPSSAGVDTLNITLMKLASLGGAESALAVADVDTGSSKNFLQFAGFYQV
jgi:hypothetical protein